MPAKKLNRPQSWESIKLGQLLRLSQLGQLGRLQDFKKIFGVNPAAVSRDLTNLETKLGVGELTEKVQHERRLNGTGKLVVESLEPCLKFIQRLVAHEIAGKRPRVFRLGAGGSLVGWLIGSRLPEIRRALRPKDRKGDESADKDLKFDIRSYKNREIVLQVATGALDCGLVRSSVVEDTRLPLDYKPLGNIHYFLYVPNKWIPRKVYEFRPGDDEMKAFQRAILSERPIATVGPEGEFPTEFEEALKDAGISANIEFAYRAFPQCLAHMMLQTHVTVMPNVKMLQGTEIPDYTKFPLELLRNYSRSIYLVYHKEHEERTPWMNVEELVNVLTFESGITATGKKQGRRA